MIYQDIDQIVSTTHDTVNKLSKNKNWWDAIILYFRYIQQKKMQQNNQTLSTDDFMIKAMWWWRERFYKTKKILIDEWLIEVVKKNNELWQIIWWYIKVNFVIQSSRVSENQSLADPQSGKTGTNTPVININTPIIKENTLGIDDRNKMFDEFWELYPRKKWKNDAQKKYPYKDHNDIMIWLKNYISEYDSLAKLWKTVPDWQHWSTWINKKTRLDYQDSKEIEDMSFEAIYQEYVKDYPNEYAKRWKIKYWVSHEPDSLFMRCKKRIKEEWLFKY